MSYDMILGLDVATKTGWCLMRNGKVYESGVQDFSKRRGESNGAMFLRFRTWINSLLSNHQIKIVIYEQSHFRGGSATEICVNLTGRVQESCAEKEIEHAPVKTTELKKWATGKGNADKGQMMARAVTYLGREPIDDNEADAALIAAWGHAEYGG